jgi:DNA-binding NtrC family response regulator
VARILIVDDDPVQRRLLDNMVQKFGYEAVLADGGQAACTVLTGANPERIDCVILDLMMPDLDGFGVLARIREAGSTVPVIVQTAHGGLENAIAAMQAGAADFVVKPVGPERLQVSLRNALEKSVLAGELARIKRSHSGTLSFKDIVTRSPKMVAVLHGAEKAAASGIPVSIEGESGVGKELIARAIHGQSERRSKPFVAVNCGAIPENLVESTLFGHEKGAFTGATDRHTGKFIEASGGTLFLDEIGELPMAAQVKLLRAIQEGEVEPVGGRKPIKVDVRLISATNRNLLDDVKQGRFRDDLYYRLHVFPVAIPPLRERAEDIPDLVRHFLTRFAAEEGKTIRTISGEALSLLCRHPWPGNVRQLENTVFRAVVLAETDTIGINEIPQIAAQAERSGISPPLVPDQPELAVPNLSNASALEVPSVAPTSPDSLRLLTGTGDIRPMDEIERDVIRFAIAYYDGQMSKVARRLQIGRSTLYRKIEQFSQDQDRDANAKV